MRGKALGRKLHKEDPGRNKSLFAVRICVGIQQSASFPPQKRCMAGKPRIQTGKAVRRENSACLPPSVPPTATVTGRRRPAQF